MACFAWNKDQSKIAMCPNSSEIWVFKTNNAPNDSTKWERIQVLKEVRRDVGYIFSI
jgi:actin related protein 2/3 complex subunit 1A/1B